jgi:hypothetical protein
MYTEYDLVAAIIRKRKMAIVGYENSQKDFEALASQRTPEEIREWTLQAENADRRRYNDPTAMDIYETTQVARK